MPNGKPGDHPLTDILIHRTRVFSLRIDRLVRELSQFLSIGELSNMFDWFAPPRRREFAAQLRALLEKLKKGKED